MLSTYVSIAQAIHTAVPDLRWFDLDKGQLDDPTAFNSLILPAVLIGQADIVWKQLGAKTLLGEGTITLKTVLRLPAQTHLLDPMLADNLTALSLADQVSQTAVSLPGITGLINTKDYPIGTFYVIEHTFQCLFKDGPSYSTVIVNTQINPQLNIPR